jgi:hypothetical protein
MKEYKVKQYIYNKTIKVDDNLSDIQHSIKEMADSEMISYICDYFSREMKTIFPAKSFAVAIIYSRLIEKYFNEPFYTCLKDKDLFLGTDKYFIPYDDGKNIYDKSISYLELHDLFDFEKNDNILVKKTVQYFYDEFLWKEGSD